MFLAADTGRLASSGKERIPLCDSFLGGKTGAGLWGPDRWLGPPIARLGRQCPTRPPALRIARADVLNRFEDLAGVCSVRRHVVHHPEGLKVIGLIDEESAFGRHPFDARPHTRSH